MTDKHTLATVIAKRLNLIHFDGEGCGTYGNTACSNCHGPSPMSADEIGDDLATVIAKHLAATPVAPPPADNLAAVIAAHQFGGVLGDYDTPPKFGRFIQCGEGCDWEQSIAGMNGWRSWAAAHATHAADEVRKYLASASAEDSTPAILVAVTGALR